MLFPPPVRELSDAELAEILRDAIMASSTGRRDIDLALVGVRAEALVDRLRLAGLVVGRVERSRASG